MTSNKPFTILDEGKVIEVTAVVDNETAYLHPASLTTALGWEHKPQGLCQGDICIPIPPQLGLVSEAGLDLVKLAQVLGRPLAIDTAEQVAYLGVSAQTRAEALATLNAPDFTLPDLEGRLHTLSHYRGKKVFLVAYASW